MLPKPIDVKVCMITKRKCKWPHATWLFKNDMNFYRSKVKLPIHGCIPLIQAVLYSIYIVCTMSFRVIIFGFLLSGYKQMKLYYYYHMWNIYITIQNSFYKQLHYTMKHNMRIKLHQFTTNFGFACLYYFYYIYISGHIEMDGLLKLILNDSGRESDTVRLKLYRPQVLRQVE